MVPTNAISTMMSSTICLSTAEYNRIENAYYTNLHQMNFWLGLSVFLMSGFFILAFERFLFVREVHYSLAQNVKMKEELMKITGNKVSFDSHGEIVLGNTEDDDDDDDEDEVEMVHENDDEEDEEDEEDEVLADESVVLADESVVLADESVVLADESVVLANESVVQ